MAQAPQNTDQAAVRQALDAFQAGTLVAADGSAVTNASQAIATALLTAREQSALKSGHRGGGGTAHGEGRSGSSGSGRSGRPDQRSTNR